MNDMRKQYLTAMIACAAVIITAAGQAFSAYPGKVDGIRLENSKSSYRYSDGAVFKDGTLLQDSDPEKERARRVALFSLWLERDPFFIAPARDLEGMGQTLLKLAVIEARVLSLHDKPEKLYPVEFLSAYVEASSSFDKFGASPSESLAAAALAKIRLAVAEYSAAAEKISASVDRFYTLRGIDRLAATGGGGVTNKATVLADFALIKKNGAAAAARVAELAKCLEKSSLFCKPDWPVLRELPPQSRPTTSIFSPKDLGLVKWPVSGPYLMRAPCWHGQKDNYFYYHERCEGDGVCLDWDYIATDMLFRPTTEQDPEMKEKGMKLAMMGASSLYACGDKEYLPALRAMAHFDRDYGNRRIFDGEAFPILPPPAAAAVEAVEKSELDYFSEKVKSQASFERLGRSYIAALRELDSLDLPVNAELRRRGRLTTLYTENFSYSLGRIVFHVRHYVRTLLGMKPLPPEPMVSAMYVSRNFYSLMFMPFSPTVWRIPERPAYLSSMETLDDGRVLHYPEALRTYGQKEISAAIKNYSEYPNGRRRNIPE